MNWDETFFEILIAYGPDVAGMCRQILVEDPQHTPKSLLDAALTKLDLNYTGVIGFNSDGT